MRIIGTGSAVPEKIVTNEDLTAFLDTSDEWISSRTGIRERRVMTTETLGQLSGNAALAALENAGVKAEEIDMILCSTVQGEWVTPGLGCVVQRAIGATCPAVDVNGACAGFLYALDMADAYLATQKAKHILIVCGEGMTRLVDWTRRETCVLFGDGAGAVVVDGGEGLMAMRLTTRTETMPLFMRASTGNSPFIKETVERDYLHMAGQEVYRFAVSACVEDLRVLMDQAGLNAGQIDHYLLHQANLRILEAVRSRIKQPRERFPHNLERYGNTSSASLVILLDELNRAGALEKGQIFALAAFGAGLVTGACLMKWNP